MRRRKGVTVTGIREEPSEGGEILLNPVETTQFRAIAARFNYLAADCPNLQFATKEICREMSAPTVRSHEKMKRPARYLVSICEVKLYYRWQDDIKDLCVCVDSDWAGCRRTRKSTSGGCMMIGRHLLRTRSSTQPSIAMSSAEAEYYALVEGATRSLGLQSMMRELGLKKNISLQTDSSAAKSFASQRGLGRMRHIEVKDTWLQGAI